MKEQDFSQLVESIRQAGRIGRGQEKPSRSFRYPVPDAALPGKTEDEPAAKGPSQWIPPQPAHLFGA